MSIGPDIKDALKEVAITATILRDSGNVENEYIDYDPNAQVTKPFVQEFFLECSLTYDTQIVIGDIIQFDTTTDKYLVMNKTANQFENAVISYNGILYKSNTVVDVYRPVDIENRDDQYLHHTIWTLVKADVNVLLTTALHGYDLEDSEIGKLSVKDLELYISTSVGAQELDRIIVSSREYYKIETVKKRRYSAVDVCDLGNDTRSIEGSNVTTTTSTTSSSTTTSSSSTTTTTSP